MHTIPKAYLQTKEFRNRDLRPSWIPSTGREDYVGGWGLNKTSNLSDFTVVYYERLKQEKGESPPPPVKFNPRTEAQASFRAASPIYECHPYLPPKEMPWHHAYQPQRDATTGHRSLGQQESTAGPILLQTVKFKYRPQEEVNELMGPGFGTDRRDRVNIRDVVLDDHSLIQKRDLTNHTLNRTLNRMNERGMNQTANQSFPGPFHHTGFHVPGTSFKGSFHSERGTSTLRESSYDSNHRQEPLFQHPALSANRQDKNRRNGRFGGRNRRPESAYQPQHTLDLKNATLIPNSNRAQTSRVPERRSPSKSPSNRGAQHQSPQKQAFDAYGARHRTTFVDARNSGGYQSPTKNSSLRQVMPPQ